MFRPIKFIPFVVFLLSSFFVLGQTTNLEWDANVEDDLAGYNIWRSMTQGGGYQVINSSLIACPANDTSCTNYSDSIALTAPSLSLVLNNGNQVALSWPATNAQQFEVVRNGQVVATLNAGNYSFSETLPDGTFSYLVRGLWTFYYVATAVDQAGNESGFSNEVFMTHAVASNLETVTVNVPPAPPSILRVVGQQGSTFYLQGTEFQNASLYRVYDREIDRRTGEVLTDWSFVEERPVSWFSYKLTGNTDRQVAQSHIINGVESTLGTSVTLSR